MFDLDSDEIVVAPKEILTPSEDEEQFVVTPKEENSYRTFTEMLDGDERITLSGEG